MAIIKGFRSTDVWNAFVLNGIATSIAVIVAIFLKDFWDKQNNSSHVRITKRQIIITFISTFAAVFLAYTALHLIFGFGGGMLVLHP